MGRRVKNKQLDSKTARASLPARGKPYYHGLGKNLHLGFRKGKTTGVWVARFYVGDKAYITETIAGADDDNNDADGLRVLDFWQAQDKAREVAQKRKDAAKLSAGPLTVGQILDEYLTEKEKEKNVDDSRYRVEALIRPALGSLIAAELTTDEIKAWHRKVSETPSRLRTKQGKEQQFGPLAMDKNSVRKRKATANRTLTILKAALTMAFISSKLADDAPWRRVLPFAGTNVARVRYLELDEAIRLLDACEPDFRNLVEAALQTGARYSELSRLHVRDFNSDTAKVFVETSKSGKSRHVSLTQEGAEFFASVSANKKRDDLLLTKTNGSAWLTGHQKRPMAEACKKAKIAPPITFHGMRHTWASLSIQNKEAPVPIFVVAKNLGHADTRMVEQHYGHLAQDYIDKAVSAGAPRFRKAVAK